MAVQTEVVGALRLVPVLIAAHTLVRLALALLPVLKLAGQGVRAMQIAQQAALAKAIVLVVEFVMAL